ncbi:hypothetical protein LINGRAHAP2_LOCUS20577 [Linum grandiflorum]
MKKAQPCRCVISETSKFSCRCKLRVYLADGGEVYPYHLHHFSGSLNYASPSDLAEWEDHNSVERRILYKLVDEACSR